MGNSCVFVNYSAHSCADLARCQFGIFCQCQSPELCRCAREIGKQIGCKTNLNHPLHQHNISNKKLTVACHIIPCYIGMLVQWLWSSGPSERPMVQNLGAPCSVEWTNSLGGVHFKDDSKWQFSVSQKWSHFYFLLVRCLLVWLTGNLSPKANVESLGDHNMTAQCWHDSTKYFLFKIMFETSSCQTLICVETENNIPTTKKRQEEFTRAKSCRTSRKDQPTSAGLDC